MPQYPKPDEGSWTEHYRHLGTGPVSYEDCVSPEFYEDERRAVFERAWLNVGRVEDVPRNGSYFTRRSPSPRPRSSSSATSRDRCERSTTSASTAATNSCGPIHRSPTTSGSTRAFTCRYHGWRYDLQGACTFVQQESEFFDFDKADHSLSPVHCEVWAGFIFVNLADEPPQSLHEFLGPMVTALDGYPFDRLTERYDFTADIACNWKVFADAFQEYYHVPILHPQEATPPARAMTLSMGFEAPHYQLDGPHRMVSTVGRAPPHVAGRLPVPDRAGDPQRSVRPMGRT